MLLQLTDVSDEPLHGQISRQLRARILAGELEDGESLPSIRSMARQARVSVITVQRAYDDLEREGLLLARRGKGFFVRQIPEERREALAERRFRESAEPLVREGRAEGLAGPRMVEIFRDVIDQPEENDDAS
jgi:GntR family transcriptional regulator